MKTQKPQKQRTQIYLEPTNSRKLKKIAYSADISMSEAIRRIIDKFIVSGKKLD